MKRLGIFAFFSFLLGMCMLHIDDEEGAGADGKDPFDVDLDDDQGKEGGEEKKDDTKLPAKEPEKKDPNAELIEEIKQERALNAIAKEMKSQYGEKFDMDKIVEKLNAMEKENKGSGQALFNKVGIENVFLKHFANEEEGEFDGSGGRKSKNLTEDELIDKINSGKASDAERLAFYEKYM